jgi:hypothetical protein
MALLAAEGLCAVAKNLPAHSPPQPIAWRHVRAFTPSAGDA